MFDYIFEKYKHEIYEVSPYAHSKSPRWASALMIISAIIITFTAILVMANRLNWALTSSVVGVVVISPAAILSDIKTRSKKSHLSVEYVVSENKYIVQLLESINCLTHERISWLVECCRQEIGETQKGIQPPYTILKIVLPHFLTLFFNIILSIISEKNLIDIDAIIRVVNLVAGAALLIIVLWFFLRIIIEHPLYKKKNVLVHMKKRLEYIATEYVSSHD